MTDIDWACGDCDMDTRTEYYTVHDIIWEVWGNGEDLLCVGCLERRMGRELGMGDFPHYLINVVNRDEKSDRLYNRLTRTL